MTKTGCLRIALSGVILAGLGGCAFDSAVYTMGRYGSIRPVNVTLRCRDTYDVTDRADAFSLLVGTNAVNEVLAGCFDGGPDVATRQREVARIYLAEKSGRPLCRISDERAVTLTHREFSYVCPDDPKATPRLQLDPGTVSGRRGR